MASIYRYNLTVYDELEEKNSKDGGYVWAKNLTKALKKIESIYTAPDHQTSNIVSVDSLYDVDDFDCGILIDRDIQETYEAEKKFN